MDLARFFLPLLLLAGPLRAALTPEETDFFEKEIRPLLAEHCYQCHSKQADRIRGGLLLDTATSWQVGGDSGEVIIPGEPENSRLIRAVRYEDGDFQMPPKYKLEEGEIAALEKWIAMGAPDPRGSEAVPAPSAMDVEKSRDYWAFRDLQSSPDKATIDAFVQEKLAQAGLKPAAQADRTTLIRRAYFDLIGLPPTPARIDAFLRDTRPDKDAFEGLIDTLLASDAFGERWGRHWLDVVRYAESMGRTRNYPFPYAWRYRDYVIDSFNADKPYDHFIREQIAGDLLPAESREQGDQYRAATAFLALGSMDLNERDREQYRMDVVDEQIDVTGRAILALTTGCARCHDHKFDPIPQKDYYALAGIFRSTRTLSGYQNRQGGNRGGFTPELLVKLDSVAAEVVAEEEARMDPQVQKQLKKQEKELAKVTRQLRSALRKGTLEKNEAAAKGRTQRRTPAIAALQKRQRDLRQGIARARRALNAGRGRKSGPKVPRTANYSMGVSNAAKAEDCRINIRGEARNPGQSVPRGFLQVLCPEGDSALKKPSQSGRLELAQWLTSSDNPLTARVLVNRLWYHLLGQGLVGTVDNFGAMGERPSHPELLDHLALRFMEGGWFIKTMIREIMLSQTYCRSSEYDARANERDPQNRLLWRANVRRLESEPLRDALLAISGRLQRGRPKGSPVMYRPFKDMRRVAQMAGRDENWNARRSIYLPIMRGFVPAFLQVFDFAEPSQVMGRRDVTTVSTQALFFMNSPFLMAQARRASENLLANQTNPEARLTTAYRLCLGRPPTSEEAAASEEFLRSTAGDGPREQWSGLFQALFASAEFRYLR